MPSLLSLPLELLLQICTFCFTLPSTSIQLIRPSLSPRYNLNFPLALYLVYRKICAALHPFQSNLSSLYYDYVPETRHIGCFDSSGSPIKGDGSLFEGIIQLVERMRLIGDVDDYSGFPQMCGSGLEIHTIRGDTILGLSIPVSPEMEEDVGYKCSSKYVAKHGHMYFHFLRTR